MDQEKIVKYKKRLDGEIKSKQMDIDKVNHILKRLQCTKMSVKLLDATKIGKTVNSLRHHEKFGEKAKKLVSQWKQLAISESDTSGASKSNSSDEDQRISEPPTTDHPVGEKPKKTIYRITAQDFAKPEQKPEKSTKKRKSTEDGFTPGSGLSFMDVLSIPDVNKQSSNGETSKKRSKKGSDSKGEKKNGEIKLDWSGGQGISPNYKPVQKRNINAYLNQLGDNEAVLLQKQTKTKESGSHQIDPNMFKAKHNMTKVFAGRKLKSGPGTGLTEVPKLLDICKRFIADNLDALEDTGNIPFDLLEDALSKATPTQLMHIDGRNENLQDDTEVLWEKHCKKDFRGSEPHEDESWRELYKRQLAERERKLEKLASTIAKKEKLNKSPQKVAKLAEAKAPRDVRRAQAKFGTFLSRGREVANVEDVIATRRQIDAANPREKRDMKLKETAIFRPGNSFVVSQEKKHKPMAAPMMKKSMKMFQRAMKRK